MNFNIPSDAQYIIDKFYRNGYEAFLVGGCIRDILLNKKPIDFDIATSASPNITESLFEKTIPTGIKHGTVTVLINNTQYEVTTYRTESNYIDNRRPDEVKFVTNIKEDLSRRDFTINAFAYNNTEGLLDYFSGLEDLNNKLIRCVGSPNVRFNEDALRMLRAIRFSAQLDFEIDNSTYNGIKDNYRLINNISNERIRDELSKILLCDSPLKGLTLLRDTNILKLIFSNSIDYINLAENIALLPKDLPIRLCSIFINFKNIDLVASLLKSLHFSNNEITKTILFIENYKKIELVKSKLDCKKLIISTGKDNIYDLITTYEALEETTLPLIRNYTDMILSNNEALFIKDINIDGKVLKNTFNIKSGKLIGEVLKYLLDMVLKEDIENTPQILLKESEKYILSQSKSHTI